MSQAPLDHYLSQQISQASPDSSGCFTLSQAEALRKLARFQLPGSQTWATKVIQAAVAGGATRISLKLMEREAVFRLGGPIGWKLETVQESFRSPAADLDPGLFHRVTEGMRGSLVRSAAEPL